MRTISKDTFLHRFLFPLGEPPTESNICSLSWRFLFATVFMWWAMLLLWILVQVICALLLIIAYMAGDISLIRYGKVRRLGIWGRSLFMVSANELHNNPRSIRWFGYRPGDVIFAAAGLLLAAFYGPGFIFGTVETVTDIGSHMLGWGTPEWRIATYVAIVVAMFGFVAWVHDSKTEFAIFVRAMIKSKQKKVCFKVKIET